LNQTKTSKITNYDVIYT